MKLYQELILQDYTKISQKDLQSILVKFGADHIVEFAKKKKQFISFVFYFIHAYSFESTMMNSETYNESLKNIELHLNFDFESFKTSFGEEFDEEYSQLIAWYLKVQKNRQFELLMTGLELYDQMIKACTSRAILKRSKDDGDLNIDYKAKKDMFDDANDIHEKLKLIEASLYKQILLEEKATTKKVHEIRIESFNENSGL